MNDTTLEELLTVAGSAYEVPEDAFARVLEAAGESGGVPARRRFDHPRLAAAGLLLVAAVGGATLWSGHGGRSAATRAALPASPQTAESTDQVGSDFAANSPSHGLANGPATTPTDSIPVRAAAGGSAGKALAPTTDGAKIVHTGTLTLSVAKGQVTPTLTRVTGLATGIGGYVASSTTAETGSKPSGTVVLRVPAGEYDAVLTQARTLGTVASTASAGQDVTAQAADQQARLTALKASRDQFLTILARAKTIGETLAVQQKVDDAQTQIDQLQGQINVLSSQASYGTLTVTVSQKVAASVAAKPVHRQSGLSKAWHSAVTGFVTGVESLIARSGRALLVLLVLVVAAVVLRIAWKLGRRRFV